MTMFELPTHPTRPIAVPPTPAGERLRVLVVEDEPRLRQYLGEAVRQLGLDGEVTATAEAARRYLAGGGTADLLLLDLNLPGEDGLSLLRAIREGGSHVPAIILTGYGTLEAARLAIRLDAVDFLAKPCPLAELEQAVSRAMLRTRLTVERPAPVASLDDDAAPLETSAATPAEPLADTERRAILAAIRRHDGNRAAAAEELGISERTLYYRLKQYGSDGRH